MEKIKPAFVENIVPICFSANDNYIPLLATQIVSIIKNSSNDKNYDIVILMTQINDENKVKLLSLISNHPNFSIRFVDVAPYVYGYSFYIESDITNTKYSDEIYFRVLAPAIMADYDHVIYLDADLIVLDDLAHLLECASDNHLIAAVRDYEGIANCYNNNYERTKYRITELGITNFDDYFISGVLVMNNKMFNERFSTKELLDLAISKNWKQYDQDLLNYICKGSVTIFDAKWDFVEDIHGVYHSMPKHLLDEYEASEKDPKIIHYSAKRKPWFNPLSKYSRIFWEYAKLTPYNDELIALISED